jgi:hypothetical protein
LGKAVGATRLLIAGSYVTAKERPDDVDAVIYLPKDFDSQLEQMRSAALELNRMLEGLEPEELFPAESWREWKDWLDHFAKIRGVDDLLRGTVQIWL